MTEEDIQDWILNPPQALLDALQLENFNFFFNPGMEETGQSYIYRSFFYAGMVCQRDVHFFCSMFLPILNGTFLCHV